MIILGVDYGTKRVGVASGDSVLAMAFPLKSVEGGVGAADAVIALAVSEGAERIVVGMPHRIDDVGGEMGDSEQRATAFVEVLKAKTAIMVDTEDERLTSAYADSIRAMSGAKKKQFDQDSVAAAAILETYMTRIKVS